MKKIILVFSFFAVVAGCYDDPVLRKKAKSNSSLSSTEYSEGGVDCYSTTDVLLKMDGKQIGITYLTVDEIQIQFNTDFTMGEWFIGTDSAWVGACGMDTRPSEVQATRQFFPDDNSQWADFNVPLAGLPECGCIIKKTQIARYNSWTSGAEVFDWIYEIPYCKCESDEGKNYRTETQSEWGAEPNGPNAGTYLHDHFALFSDGMWLGCSLIRLTSASAVTEFLPQQGAPVELTDAFANPGPELQNELAGQLAALRLTLAFDAADEGFSEARLDLRDARISTGTFKGFRVEDVYYEGERALGGCDPFYTPDPNYTPAEVNEIITAINESFPGGVDNNNGLLE